VRIHGKSRSQVVRTYRGGRKKESFLANVVLPHRWKSGWAAKKTARACESGHECVNLRAARNAEFRRDRIFLMDLSHRDNTLVEKLATHDLNPFRDDTTAI
jgi:hypothetical protein